MVRASAGAIAVGAVLAVACAAPRAGEPSEAISLGARTSAPTEDVARELDLPFRVRVQGRVVDEVVPGGAAASAGVRPGDVILRVDDLDLFSQDDLDDWLRTKEPGDRVALDRVRRETKAREAVTASLGPRDIPASPFRVRWDFAGLVSLPRALETARAQKKKVLVGLTGAET